MEPYYSFLLCLILSIGKNLAEAEFINDQSQFSLFCNQSSDLKIYRDVDQCDQYFISCVLKELPITTDTTEKITLMEPYKIEARRCENGYLFDNIEKKCFENHLVDCNATQEIICQKDYETFPDFKQNTVFIECLNGSVRRQDCRPIGTIFDADTGTCIYNHHPPNNSEDFSLSFLRIVLKFMMSTRTMLTPWMEKVSINSTPSTTKINASTESVETPAVGDETEDEIIVFKRDTLSLVLYYGLMCTSAILMVLGWFLISFFLSKVFQKCESQDDEDDVASHEDFYPYNQNDRYVMTRL